MRWHDPMLNRRVMRCGKSESSSTFRSKIYALWRYRKWECSWVPIPVTTLESGPSIALKMTVPSTTEENMCKKNDLLKLCFGRNDATKKTTEGLMKHQLQKIVRGLQFLCRYSSRRLNVKFVRSLPSVSMANTLVNTAYVLKHSTASFSDATFCLLVPLNHKGSTSFMKNLEQLHDDDLEEIDLSGIWPD
ncbi:hypothetical protein Tco_1407529 [Tanacetum coccineum]